jgi:hypothetical protein
MSQQQAYGLFELALRKKSPFTRATYESEIRTFLRTERLSLESFLSLEALSAEDRIKNYIASQTYNKANKLVSALQILCGANRKALNWDHVALFMPEEPEREDKLRPYTPEEVSTAVSEADLREKTAMLCMASGGPRVGGLEDITIDKSLLWVAKYDLYACIIYPGSKAEYMTFFTPQCSGFIDELKADRTEGYLFENKKESGQAVSRKRLYEAINKVLIKANLVADDLQPDHSFRKFFRSQLTNAGITKDNAKLLMGRAEKLEKIYDMHHALEHLENTQYFKAIQNLTV